MSKSVFGYTPLKRFKESIPTLSDVVEAGDPVAMFQGSMIQMVANFYKSGIYSQYKLGLDGFLVCDVQEHVLEMLVGEDETRQFIEYCRK